MSTFNYELSQEKVLLEVLRAIQEERYATAEVMLKKFIGETSHNISKEVMDSSYPDGDGYWKDAKENVA